MANKIQLRRGTKAQILSAAGSLAEPLYSWDTKELFIGNGTGANTPLVSATSANITYYVRTDGNDANTGLANTAGGAFKTIGKAIGMIPTIVDHVVIVNVAAGTYAESPKLSGFNGGGYVGIYGTGVVNVASMIIERCQRIQVFGITFTSTTTDSVNTYDGGFIEFRNCVFTVASSFNAISSFNQNSKIESCTFSNRNTAIQVNGGQCYIVECLGTNNIAAVLPAEGTIVKTAGTIHAGIIHTGFNGIVNPWGDNTDATRAAGDMSRNASIGQPINANTLSKIIFTFAANNQKGISDIANSRFVVPETGYYLVNGRVGLTGGSTYSQYLLYINGSINAVLGESTQNASSGLTLSGASILRLQAGWTLEFYVFVNTNATISPNPESTSTSLIRIA